MKIYVDMLFAINFSMDFVSLFITATIMRRKIHKKRILISAALGALFGVFEVLATLAPMISVILGVLVSFLMCFVAYYEKSVKRFTAMYIIYWGVSACLGGLMSVLYSFLNKILAEYIQSYTYTTVYTGARFFIISALAILISVLLGRLFASEKDIKSVDVEVKVGESLFKLTALCDSGNLLKDPFSGKSVILISEKTELGQIICETPDIYKRYIPYSAVGAQGLLKGLAPDRVIVNGVEKSALVASIDKKDFAGFEACAPQSLVV